MIYLLEGNEPYLIKQKIRNIVPFNDVDSSIYEFNGNDKDFNINDVLASCDGISLLSSKAYVLVMDPPFLIKKDDKDIDQFLNYCLKPNYETDLIIYTYDNLFNRTLKSYKTIIKNAEHIICDQLDNYNFKSSCKQYVLKKKLNIKDDALNTLINKCNCSTTTFIANVDILENYPCSIDEKCVEKLCSYDITEDIFNLINNLSSLNITKSIEILHNLYNHDFSVFYIIATLSSQLRFIYEVSYYYEKGYLSNKIANVLNANQYRVDMTLKRMVGLNTDTIIEILSKLSKLDELNKLDSSIEPNDRFELFIIKNFRSNNA